MADAVLVLSTAMRDRILLGSHHFNNGVESAETESQGSRDDNSLDREPGFVEERFRVDRKKLEQMLQLVPPMNNSNEVEERADEFFQRVMEQTSTQITWPSKLKIGAKSKKDPHIKVIGYPENVCLAKSRIMTVLDTKSNRVTLKMDVSHTEHSHVIGKGGNNIKRVMTQTGCHIHFPDSNRGNNSQDKSNQVSIAGQPEGVETARCQIRELLPLVYMFELPVSSSLTPLPDPASPFIQQLQQTHNVTISFKQRPRTYATTAIIRGSVHGAKAVKQATSCLMEQLTGSVNSTVSMQLEIAPQHHMFIIGRGGLNVKHIMQQTGANVLFPDPNIAQPQRKGTVFIHGNIESAYLARQYLIGCLPLVLMFDVKDTSDLDQGRISQLMEALDVYISVKPKPKQPSKSVIVKSIERNAANMYLTREILLGSRPDSSIISQHANFVKANATQPGSTHVSIGGLGLLSPRVLRVNTDNFQLNGQTNSANTTPVHCPPSPNHWLAHNSVPVFSPVMVVTPTDPMPPLDVLSPRGTNGIRQDLSSALIRLPASRDSGPASNKPASPTHSASHSPTTVALCNTAADLASLPRTTTLEVLSPESVFHHLPGPLSSPMHQPPPHYLPPRPTLHNPHQRQHQPHPLHHQSRPLYQPPHPLQQRPSMDFLGLGSKTCSLSQLSALAQCTSSPPPLFNGMTHHHGQFMTEDKLAEPASVSEKLAPGIERKSLTSSLFSAPFQFDYEQKKLLAMKAMQKKPEGESRIPTDIWAGLGFSKSMPESAIRDKLGQMGISARVTDASLNLGYETNRPEIDLNIDKDLWNNDTSPERGMTSNRPLNKAPGEYPSPRKKFQYLSHSNHVDSASLPSKSVWCTKTDLAELLSALGLGKYTDLFQQQEIDLSTFLTLSDNDLRELGISTFGARRKMLLAIADLNKRRTLTAARVSSLDRTAADHNKLPSCQSSSGGLDFTRGNGANSAGELFPPPKTTSSLLSTRGGPDLGSLSGHW